MGIPNRCSVGKPLPADGPCHSCGARSSETCGEWVGLADRAAHALYDMVGLVDLLLARDDLPAELREVLKTSHRVIEARAAVEAFPDRSAAETTELTAKAADWRSDLKLAVAKLRRGI